MRHALLESGCPLTPSQLAVLKSAAKLKTTRASSIAQDLCLSQFTVRIHFQHILDALGVHSRMEAFLVALQNGWIASPALIGSIAGAADS